jgi:hypothetical protein
MLAPVNSPGSSASDEYRRQARKLRAQYGNDLGALHKALSDLSRQTDQTTASVPTKGPAAEFAELVAHSLEGPILRYSNRQALLAEAERRGISRFEANLIIAAVQHQSDRAPRPSRPTPEKTTEGCWHAAAAACFVQAFIFVAMYLLLFG